ncbi:MAG: hypothetical protein ACPHK8_06490 [Thermoplasmatota archaeon]
MLRFIGTVLLGTAKFGIRHVLVPIAISAATAAVATALAEKIRESTPEAPGHEPVITPEP